MRKIGLFLAATPFDGGAFQYSHSVLKALSDLSHSKFRITVIYCNPHWKTHVEEIRTIEGRYLKLSRSDQIVMKLLKLGLIPEVLWKLTRPSNTSVKVLANEACDAWIFPSQDAWSYFFAERAIVSIFDLMHRYEKRFPEVSRALKYFRRELHYRKICRGAAGVLVDSNVGKQHVVDSYSMPQHRVHVLPFVSPPQPIDIDEQNAQDLPPKYFFYPAQFWEHKNHENLLKATARLAEDIPDVHLVLVGSKKNNYAKTLKLIRALGLSPCVQVLGYVSETEKRRLYRNARALVMPTFFGPTNLPPLEAMRLGCPVAISDIYGMREQLGSAAVFFEPTSIEAIRDAMFALWTDDDLCARLKRLGTARCDAWTPANFAERLGAVLQTELDGKAPSEAPRQ